MASDILQLKITLKYSQPPIWRRIQIDADSTFLHLHAAIQDSFGWEECHLHQFIVGKRHTGQTQYIGPRSDEDYMVMIPESQTKVTDVLKRLEDKCIYEYDFGDGWDHEVVLEKILPAEADVKYPRCVAGKRACPPEDSGGIGGYEYKLEILKHPESEDFDDVRDWMGNDFDPEHFDTAEVRFQSASMHDFENWED